MISDVSIYALLKSIYYFLGAEAVTGCALLKKAHLKICQIHRKQPSGVSLSVKLQATSQEFYCEFYVIFKNDFLIELPLAPASKLLRIQFGISPPTRDFHYK